MDMSMNILCFFIFILIVWIWWRKRKFSIFERHGIPGPKPNFWTGNLNEVIEKRGLYIQEYLNKYGPIVGWFLGPKPFVFVSDPELLKIIEVKEFATFSNRDSILPGSAVPNSNIYQNVAIVKDEKWKRIRTLLNPSFSSGKLRKMTPIFNGVIDIFLEKIAEKAKSKESFNLYSMIKNLSLDAITKSSFAVNTNIQHGKNSLFLDSTTLFLNPDITDTLIIASICFPELEPLPTKLRTIIDAIKYIFNLPSVRKVFSVIEELIVQRKKSDQKQNDLLQSLIDESIDEQELHATTNEELAVQENDDLKWKNKPKEVDKTPQRNRFSLSAKTALSNLAVFMVVGYDTTSSMLGFFCHYVSRYPEIQEKIRKEITEHVDVKRKIEYDDLPHFKYLDQVISEILRLHSVTELTVNRIVKKSFKYNGITIPKGVTISVPVNSLHRNPKYWSDPDKFDPERFSMENKSKINPITYQPFGYGPRNCIGMRYAQTLMKLVLARFLKSYRLESCFNKECEVNYSLFINHPKEVLIKVIPV